MVLRADKPPAKREQHDDHIWLTVGGSSWAIQSVEWPIIWLWRGYWPHLEYSCLDVQLVDWEKYHRKWVEMNYSEARL